MPTPTQTFHDVAARHGKVDPSDAEAVQHWFTDVLPTLPKDQIEEILEELLAHDGDSATPPGLPDPGPAYPKDAPLPSLEDSPAVTYSVLKQLASALMAKIKSTSKSDP